MTDGYDIAIVGGGIMGCATALRTVAGGMRPIVLDRGDLGQGASGVNAGTLSLQIKRVKLMPYALKGHHAWEAMGDAVGFEKTGGYTLAFTEREVELLHERQKLKAEAGAPITFVSNNELRAAEPNLTHKVLAASYCPEDGYANSSLTGRYYRIRLQQADVPFRERSAVTAITRNANGFELTTAHGPVHASRLLLAAGAWLKPTAELLGVGLPVRARINTVSVTERMPPLTSTVIGHATGLLTMKQKANGTVLVGGGWQGRAPAGGARRSDRRPSCSITPAQRRCPLARPACCAAGPGSRRMCSISIRWRARCPACRCLCAGPCAVAIPSAPISGN